MKQKVTVVFHIEIDLLDDQTDDQRRFYVEEHTCVANYVDHINREIAKNAAEAPGTCVVCSWSSAFVGHVPFKRIAESFAR